MENPIRMDDLGVPLYLETPIISHPFTGKGCPSQSPSSTQPGSPSFCTQGQPPAITSHLPLGHLRSRVTTSFILAEGFFTPHGKHPANSP